MTTRQTLLGIVAAAALAGPACTGFESGRTVGSPNAPSPTVPGGSPSGSLVGAWGSGVEAFAIPSPSSCTNFSWTISSQSDSAIAGSFAAVCDGGVGINATASGTLHDSTTVTLMITGVALVGGVPACTFTLNGNGTLVDENTLTIPYTGETCIGPVRGTQTLRRHVDPPPPPPPPDPEPEPEPEAIGPPPGGDAFDFSQATMLNSPRDFTSWPIATKIDWIDMRSSGIAIGFSKKDGPGRWPDVTPPGWDGPLQYTLGMALFIDGRWYASTVVEYWYGLDRSAGAPSGFSTNWFYDPIRWAPMTFHQPRIGETIGFFVCEGDCRNNIHGTLSPLRERSNVVLVPMPPDTGAFYAF